MTKELIIISLILILIYYYNQQNNISAELGKYESQTQEAKNQAQYYQRLYEERVAHDLNKSDKETQTNFPNQEAITLKAQLEAEQKKFNNLKDNSNKFVKNLGYSSFQELEKGVKEIRNSLVNKDNEIKIEQHKYATLQKEEEGLAEVGRKLLDNLNKANEELEKASQLHQEQLKKINLLFDPASANYERIDFNGLYELLKEQAEREREQK
jgi:hypothetical protein